MQKSLAEVVNNNLGPTDLVNLIINACTDAKASDIKALDISKLSDIADYFIIVSGRSDRQVQGIADRVLTALSPTGIAPLSIEGEEQAHWILIDFGEVVLHVFYEPVRAHYDIEGLWRKARTVEISKVEQPYPRSGLYSQPNT